MSEETRPSNFLLRGLRTLILGLLACTVGMAIAYGSVRYLTRNRPLPGTSTQVPVTGPERRIPELASRIKRLADDFVEHIPLDVGGYSPQAEDWVRNTFRPAIDDLRSRLDDPEIINHPAAKPLKKALDQAKYLSLHPDDMALRSQTIYLMQSADQQAWDILNPNTD